MISRRNVLWGLAAAATAGCSAPQAPRQAAVAPYPYPQPPPPQYPPDEYTPPEYPPEQYPTTRAPARRARPGLDAVIDISAHTTVSDFGLVRASNILAVIHKASEGDFYADPACAERRPQAEAAGLLWGTYHFGKGDSSGAQQAAFYLESTRPSPRTLLALDLEINDGDPSNSMTTDQAEEFVQAVASATGRLPVVYVPPGWANAARITSDSVLARCGLWVVDYRHTPPEIPMAWARSGWRLWQYAGDERAVRIRGVNRCDRNVFNGNSAALYRFWNAAI